MNSCKLKKDFKELKKKLSKKKKLIKIFLFLNPLSITSINILYG